MGATCYNYKCDFHTDRLQPVCDEPDCRFGEVEYNRKNKMTKNIKSPDVYVKRVNAITVFLAGGITGCPDWQREMEDRLKNTNYTTLNPRRDGEFNTMNPEWGAQQIEWEHWHLDRADYVLFWFPKEGQCMITLFELGKCLALGKKVVIGCHPEYIREFDVRTQSRLMRPNIPTAKSLDELAMNLITLVSHYEMEHENVFD